MRPTDTALAVAGEAEWIIAFFCALGIAQDQAEATASMILGSPPGQVPSGRHTVQLRVCAECIARSSAPFPAPVLAIDGAELPVAGQP